MDKGFGKTKEDKDCRALSEGFFKRFRKGNDLYPFVELVKNHCELEFCLRGNSTPEKVIIYRNNHAMFTITSQTIYFNPNYLRYSDWEKKLKELYGFGYGKGKEIELDEVKRSSRGYSCSFKTSPTFSASISEGYLKNLERIFKTLNDIFDDYFSADEEKQIDRFLKSKGHIVSNKHGKKEKKRQQQLYRNIKEQKDGYFFYDMEYQQKHNNQAELKEDIEEKISNKPDMQAIRFKNGKAKSWVFVEVKCTESAYNGNSGLDEHIQKMKKYPDERLESRRREAYLMLYQYSELGLINLDKSLDGDEFEKLPYEGLLLFTDDAIGLWNNDTKYEEERKNNINKKIYDKVENEEIKMVLCKIS